jgi:hypothetical protein
LTVSSACERKYKAKASDRREKFGIHDSVSSPMSGDGRSMNALAADVKGRPSKSMGGADERAN